MQKPVFDSIESIRIVESQIKLQLERTGSFTPEAAGLNAQLHGAFAAAVSSRLGISPHEVYEQFPISIVSSPSVSPAASGGTFSQFAGPNAESADLYSLAKAKDRLTAGDEPHVVRMDTGWFKGADSKWRYEISDHQAKLLVEGVKEGSPVTLGSILKHDRLFEAYPDLKNIAVSAVSETDYNGMYDPINDRFEINHTRTREEQLSTILHEIQHAVQAREGFAMGGNMDRRFTEEVKNALGSLRARKSITAAEWELDNRHIIKSADRAKELANSVLMYNSYKRLVDYAHHDRPSSVFRHIRNQLEWLHCERARENPDLSRASSDIYRETYRIPKPHKMHERNVFLRELSLNTAHFLRKMIGEPDFEMFENDQRKISSLVNSLLSKSSKARANLSPLNILQSEKKRAQTLVESTQFKTPYEIYRSLAGEVEARNVQARQTLTHEERKQSHPKYTQDIDTSEIIVLYNDSQIDIPSAFYQSPSDHRHQNRGAIDVTEFPSMPAQITLFAHADMSTFLHESGHFFFEALTHIARSENAPKQIREDVATIAKWGGEKDLESYLSADFEKRREVHERFARGFEAYIMEGKAPNEQTKSIFEFFRSWLKDIYQTLKSLRVNLTDEVRVVMDRMISLDAVKTLDPLTDTGRLKAFQERQLADLERRSIAAIASHMQLTSSVSSMESVDESICSIATKHSAQMRSMGIPSAEILHSLSEVIHSAADKTTTLARLEDIEQKILGKDHKAKTGCAPILFTH